MNEMYLCDNSALHARHQSPTVPNCFTAWRLPSQTKAVCGLGLVPADVNFYKIGPNARNLSPLLQELHRVSAVTIGVELDHAVSFPRLLCLRLRL